MISAVLTVFPYRLHIESCCSLSSSMSSILFTASPLQTVCVVAASLGLMFVIMRHERLPLVFLPRFAEFRPAQVDRPSIDFLYCRLLLSTCFWCIVSLHYGGGGGGPCVCQQHQLDWCYILHRHLIIHVRVLPLAPLTTTTFPTRRVFYFLFSPFSIISLSLSLSPAINGSKATQNLPNFVHIPSWLCVCVYLASKPPPSSSLASRPIHRKFLQHSSVEAHLSMSLLCVYKVVRVVVVVYDVLVQTNVCTADIRRREFESFQHIELLGLTASAACCNRFRRNSVCGWVNNNMESENLFIFIFYFFLRALFLKKEKKKNGWKFKSTFFASLPWQMNMYSPSASDRPLKGYAYWMDFI